MIAALRADVQPAFRFLAEDGGLALGAANPQPLRHSPFASSHSRRHTSWPLMQGLQDILFAQHGLHFKPDNLEKPAFPPEHESLLSHSVREAASRGFIVDLIQG